MSKLRDVMLIAVLVAIFSYPILPEGSEFRQFEISLESPLRDGKLEVDVAISKTGISIDKRFNRKCYSSNQAARVKIKIPHNYISGVSLINSPVHGAAIGINLVTGIAKSTRDSFSHGVNCGGGAYYISSYGSIILDPGQYEPSYLLELIENHLE
ncbi:hypothetical protein SAMN04488118_1253 [Epibacterium ulvae]|uniref:Uncharacterized protein n=1 Tax=Epibacterium ulvae TaxID=1156985 RepID=A0A1G5RJR9_9RHOB|nr:hypothetical protein [Epibacterium ulvae]SCZ74287.1 hypothetical protein SAMN04488118_1253 [Epibacterium ulvae]